MDLSQLLMIGLRSDNSLDAVRELAPGGVILMGRNARSPGELRELTRQIDDILPVAAWIASDHEGGRVQRLKDGFTLWPSAREVGQGGVYNVSSMAKIAAQELRGAGVNLNFAPVCDVPTHPDDTVIGQRAFSGEPLQAGELVASYIRGAQPSIACCAKHFPGHGGVGVDSHQGLPEFVGSRGELELHLAPFRAALQSDVAAVMIGHISVPALDDSRVPASLSRRVVDDTLRGELGFDGLIITDDLEMGALDQTQSGHNAVRAFAAGCDIALFCHESWKAMEALEAIERALENGVLSEERIQKSLQRIESAKRRFGVIG